VLLPELAALLAPPHAPQAQALVAPLRAIASIPGIAIEDLARDAEPEFVTLDAALEPPAPAREPAAEVPPPASNDAARQRPPRPDPEEERAIAERLLRLLLGDDAATRGRAGSWLWAHLKALDEWLAADASRAPSHVLLFGNVLYPLGARSLDRELEPRDALALLDELVQGVAARLGVSRKDRELLLQVLAAQRRLVHPGRRVRPLAFAKREFFPDAFLLLDLHRRGTGHLAETVERWERLLRSDGQPGGRRRRRRRRRGGRAALAPEQPST
jgi:hypothetical protein